MNYFKKIMEKEWNLMANKNPLFYVFTSDDFKIPDIQKKDKFFESGKVDVDNILAALFVKPNKKWSVLDIGCGLGRLTRRLNELFGHTVGIDISEEMIKKAKEFNPSIDFKKSNGVDLKGFDDSSVDLIFSFIVFQHLPTNKLVFNYLKEIKRVLKPDGIVLFQMSTSYYPRVKRFYWNLLNYKKKNDPNLNLISFRGNQITAGKIQKSAFKLGLVPEVVLFEGTSYTYFRLSKIDINLICDGTRHSGESRKELKKLIN